MSCIGRYRRNVLTLKQVKLKGNKKKVKMNFIQTMVWVLLWCVSGMVDIVLQAVFIFYQEDWTSETIFWIWNLKGAAFNEIFHVLIPFALSVPPDDSSENSSRGHFYMKKTSVLVPRRHFENTLPNPPTKIFVHGTFEKTPWTPSKKIFVGQSARPPKKDKKSDPAWATFRNVTYKDNLHHKKVELPSIDAQNEEMVLSIPNLHQTSNFPCIAYCKFHQYYQIVS